MMDIRRCSKEEIDEIHERMKRWKQRQETKQELPDSREPQNLEQLEFPID